MQKYSPISDDTPNMREDTENGSFYWCTDVHARIAEMRKAFETSSTEVERQLRDGLRQALGLIDELERDIGQEIRGVAYYELRKLLERTGP